jgi:hypothetical protein
MNFPKFGLCGFLVRALWLLKQRIEVSKRTRGILRENLASKMVFPLISIAYMRQMASLLCAGGYKESALHSFDMLK